MKHIMVDIETLATLPSGRAVVLAVGAVRFDPVGDDNIDTFAEEDKFYMNLDIQEQIDKGLEIQGRTLRWWWEQSQEAQDALKSDPCPIKTFIKSFNEFCEGEVYLWGNGSTFDNLVLRNLYDVFGRKFPVHWRNDRDYRTLRWAANGKRFEFPFVGEKHNALHDAMNQAFHVQHWTHKIQDGVERVADQD